MTLQELSYKAQHSDSLIALRDNLVNLECEIKTQINNGELSPDIWIDDFIDLRELPKFGETTPKNTETLRSWDKDSVLRFGNDLDCTGWMIEPRGDR